MMDDLDGTWCPECGPGARVDADGCCTDCGADAAGPGSRRARVALAAEARLRGELECAMASESAALEEVARLVEYIDRHMSTEHVLDAARYMLDRVSIGEGVSRVAIYDKYKGKP